MADFAKGVSIKEKTFDNGGSITNISINLEHFMENPINDDKYINLQIKRGKESGKLYAANNEYYQKNANNEQKTDKNLAENEEEIVKFDDNFDEECPF